MVVKKIYVRVKSRWFDKKRNVFQDTEVTRYIGWFLFGFIPIYLIVVDKYHDVNFEEAGEGTIKHKLYDEYRHLMFDGR